MPRKQNGFGNPKSLRFKGAGRTDIGKKKPAPGTYPSNREYGTSVTRTVKEKFNLDSNWTKWRKGYEYYNKAAWYRLEDYDPISQEYSEAQIQSKLYQGTNYEVDVVFDGYKFATVNSDSCNHYVMKRTVVSSLDIGTISAVYNDPLEYVDQRNNRQVWCQISTGSQAEVLTRMLGERITDGETEATLINVLTSENLPAIYKGKTEENKTVVKVSIPINSLIPGEGVDIQNYQELIGKVVYIPNFFQEKSINSVTETEVIDDSYFWYMQVKDLVGSVDIQILDRDEYALPPTIYDISSLKKLFTSNNASFYIEGEYKYDKKDYQKYYKPHYLTGDLVNEKVDTVSYSVLPFEILGVEQTPTEIILVSVPFTSEFTMSSKLGDTATLVFSDYGFTKESIDEYIDEFGNKIYYHREDPNKTIWMRKDTDVDPWMDEVFTTGNPLEPAVMYSCSCPNYSQSILRAPQATENDETKSINRQRRYPLPGVLSRDSYAGQSMNSVAGIMQTWERPEDRYKFRMCKHSIAAMFIERLKIKEPNKYPTIEARQYFEEKMAKEMDMVGVKFNQSYERGAITSVEILFAMGQLLNLDDVEMAFVLLNNNF